MLQRCILLFIMTFSLFFLTGCWDYKPLERLSFASGIGIDQDQKGYIVTIQFVNPEEIAGDSHTERPESPIYQERGKTIEEALARLTLNVSHYVHLSNLQVIILGERVAKKNIQDVLEYIYRFHSIRSDFKLVIAKQQKSSDILKVVSPLSKVTAEKIAKVVQKMEEGSTMTVGSKLNFFQLIKQMNTPHEGFVITGFYTYGKHKNKEIIHNTDTLTPQAQVFPTGLAVFKRNRLQGWLTIPESIGYNYIMGTARLVPETVMCSNQNTVTGYVVNTKSKITIERKRQKIQPHIQLQVTLQLTDVGCKHRLSPAYLAQLENKFAYQIEKKVKTTMHVAQNTFHADLFGLGDTFSRSNPDLWRKEKNWEKTFSNLLITYSVNVNIVHVSNNIFMKSN
ncbi:Ger(x)C family spore germination protein [Bacillus cereus]|nr:Ger(x)C family spore germination protein [Bacillus cereus]